MTAGIINVLKPPGMTSHDVVGYIRRVYGIKRVGHAGTLDPAAAGVLPVFLGTATRLIEYTTDTDKSYRVELTFGYSTDTGDDTGNVIEQLPDYIFPAPERLQAVLACFSGTIEQVPPMYSAIKIGGKRLYELAREGVAVVREPRTVVISNIELINIAAPTILFDVTCSKGTYIRSLCVDIGEKIGSPAVMSFLVRTRVGGFTLPDALTLEEIAADKEKAVLPLDYAISHLPQIILPDAHRNAFRNGQAIRYESQSTQSLFRVYDQQGELVGIGKKSPEAPHLSPIKVLGR